MTNDLSLFVIKKDGELVKVQELNTDPIDSSEIVFVWNDEGEAKEFARLLSKSDEKHTYIVCEYQLVCSKSEWN